MNKLILIAMLACAAFALPQQKHPKFQDTKTVLAEIDQDRFGSTMISAIALNIAAQSPVEELTLLLDEMISGLVEKQGNADEKNRTDQAVCDELIGGFIQQIRDEKDTIASLEQAITDNQEILEQARIDLDQAQRDYDETISSIERGTAQRALEHAKWADEDYEMQIDIATLEEGVKLITHMVHGVAFAQIQSRYDKLLDKLRTTESKHSSLFKPLITSLTQLATKLNYENVMKILELLNNIRQGIVEEQETSRQSEEKAQADWEVLLTHLTQQKQSLQDKIGRLTALIENTEALLVQLNLSLESHRVSLENAEQDLAATRNLCEQQSNEYITGTNERSREVSILQKLLDHINEKFASVNDYVASRTGPEF